MRPHAVLIGSALLLLIVPLPAAQATGDCTFTASTWRYASSDGLVSEILAVSDPAACYGSEVEPFTTCSVTVDGVPLTVTVCDGHVYCSCEAEGPMVTATSDKRFPPGDHSVVVSITLQFSTGPVTGSDSWQFRTTAQYETPQNVAATVPETCAVAICAGPAPLDVPLPWGWVETRGVTLLPGFTAEVGSYGPDRREIETPFGTIPATICPTPCPYPVVSASHLSQGSIWYGYNVLGMQEQGEVPLNLG